MLPLSPIPLGEITQARIEGLAEDAVPGDVAVELEHWDAKGWFIDVTFGVLAITAGVAGLALPVLPGWAPIMAGVVLLAGRIPPLRRVLSKAIMLEPCQKLCDRLAENPKMRKVMTKALLRKKVRAAVEPNARRTLVNLLVRRDADDDRVGPQEGATASDEDVADDKMV